MKPVDRRELVLVWGLCLLGGLMMVNLGRVPVVGDWFDWHEYRFEVMDMDGRRIDKVLATRLGYGRVCCTDWAVGVREWLA